MELCVLVTRSLMSVDRNIPTCHLIVPLTNKVLEKVYIMHLYIVEMTLDFPQLTSQLLCYTELSFMYVSGIRIHGAQIQQ
jgi:hypothetical protein